MCRRQLMTVNTPSGRVSAQLEAPEEASWLVVMAHGAGAGMYHPFMERVAEALLSRHFACFRYQFPYMEGGLRRPDTPSVLHATVRAAVVRAKEVAPGLPMLAGGKSMGGRMTSSVAAAEVLPGARGLFFLGFPLHAPGKQSISRGDHLREVSLPMLFLQGTRDKLAELSLLRPMCESLGPHVRLHQVEGADHSFDVLRRSGRTADEVLDELGDTITDWAASLV